MKYRIIEIKRTYHQVADENRRKRQLNRENKTRKFLSPKNVRLVQRSKTGKIQIPAFNFERNPRTDVEAISEKLKYDGCTSALSDPGWGGRRRSKAREEDLRALYHSAFRCASVFDWSLTCGSTLTLYIVTAEDRQFW